MAVMLTCVLMLLGRRVAARTIFLTLDLALDPASRTFTISPTSSTTGRHFRFERDYKSHTAFRSVRHYA